MSYILYFPPAVKISVWEGAGEDHKDYRVATRPWQYLLWIEQVDIVDASSSSATQQHFIIALASLLDIGNSKIVGLG